MAWQDVAEPLLRYAINDVDSPQRYDSNRIQYAWLIGAFYVSQEFILQNKYVVDLVSIDISPDPSINSAGANNADNWMINLSTLRSAIIMIGNDQKLAANSAWAIKDVHMMVDMRELHKANKLILDEAKEMYEKIRLQYNIGVNPQAAAILTPINVLAGGYRAPLYGYDSRDRMLF